MSKAAEEGAASGGAAHNAEARTATRPQNFNMSTTSLSNFIFGRRKALSPNGNDARGRGKVTRGASGTDSDLRIEKLINALQEQP